MTVTSLPFSSRTWRSSASAYLRPSWKMWPISMPRADSSVPSSQLRAGVAVADLGGLDGAVGREVAAGHQVDDVAAVDVGAGHPAGALDDAGVDEEADAGRVLLAEHAGADVALDQRGVLRELGLVRRARPRSARAGPRAASGRPRGRRAAPIASGSRVPSGCLSTTRTFLRVSAAAQGRSSRGNAALRWSTSVSMVGVSGVSSACAAGASSYAHRGGRPHLDGLDVGGVVAVRAADVGVLADLGVGEELLRLASRPWRPRSP